MAGIFKSSITLEVKKINEDANKQVSTSREPVAVAMKFSQCFKMIAFSDNRGSARQMSSFPRNREASGNKSKACRRLTEVLRDKQEVSHDICKMWLVSLTLKSSEPL